MNYDDNSRLSIRTKFAKSTFFYVSKIYIKYIKYLTKNQYCHISPEPKIFWKFGIFIGDAFNINCIHLKHVRTLQWYFLKGKTCRILCKTDLCYWNYSLGRQGSNNKDQHLIKTILKLKLATFRNNFNSFLSSNVTNWQVHFFRDYIIEIFSGFL